MQQIQQGRRKEIFLQQDSDKFAPELPEKEPAQTRGAKPLPVMEMFGPVIQGEGQMIGVQTWFLRLGGCDFRCSRCDSLHAVLPDQIKAGKTVYGQAELALELVGRMGGVGGWVTLSGGNPCMWDLTTFLREARAFDPKTKFAVETQGSLWQDWLNMCQMVTISPKGPGMIDDWQAQLIKLHSFIGKLHPDTPACLKVPVFGAPDLEFCREVQRIAEQYKLPLYLSIGNPFVPNPEDPEAKQPSLNDHRQILLRHYDSISALVMKEFPELSEAIILPQLHVLLYGNEKGK